MCGHRAHDAEQVLRLHREPSRELTLVVPLYNESHRFAACAPALADFVAAEPAGRLATPGAARLVLGMRSLHECP